MLGLKHGENKLIDYCDEWSALFQSEKKRIKSVLGDSVIAIEHFGSTSIPELPAKPVLDILVGVASLNSWIQCKEPLENLGYDYAEDAGVLDHFIFGIGRDTSERTHLIHVAEYEGVSWKSNLRFRDALRCDPDLREQYYQIKCKAIEMNPIGRSNYTDYKSCFVSEVRSKLDNQMA